MTLTLTVAIHKHLRMPNESVDQFIQQVKALTAEQKTELTSYFESEYGYLIVDSPIRAV
jgi:hypothetical protein